MSVLAKLSVFSGHWHGISALWISPQEPADKSPSSLSLTPAVKRKFVQINYTWADHSEPQEGLLLIRYQTERELAIAVWAKSLHMGEKIVQCHSVIDDDGGVDLRGFMRKKLEYGLAFGMQAACGGSLHQVLTETNWG
jgi:hypothetical protein